MDEKLEARVETGTTPGAAGDPFVDATGCKAYATSARRGLDERIKAEKNE
jgi:hypothetical protein